jgi:hypothetical protein
MLQRPVRYVCIDRLDVGIRILISIPRRNSGSRASTRSFVVGLTLSIFSWLPMGCDKVLLTSEQMEPRFCRTSRHCNERPVPQQGLFCSSTYATWPILWMRAGIFYTLASSEGWGFPARRTVIDSRNHTCSIA